MSGGFTPGPWAIHSEHRWVVPASDAFAEPTDALPICQLRDPDERLSEDETLANGFVIAAAPELYAAMAEFVERVERGEVRSIKTYNKFKSLLAKARGEA